MLFIREEIISGFKKGIFPYIDGFQVDEEADEETDEETDTTDMPELENETSTEQRRNKRIGIRLKNINTKPNA